METEDATKLKKSVIPPLIMASDRNWKTIHSWIDRNGVDSKSKVTRDRGLHISPKEVQGYRKLQDHLHRFGIECHTYALEKTELRVVMRGLPITDPKEIMEDLAPAKIYLYTAYIG